MIHDSKLGVYIYLCFFTPLRELQEHFYKKLENLVISKG